MKSDTIKLVIAILVVLLEAVVCGAYPYDTSPGELISLRVSEIYDVMGGDDFDQGDEAKRPAEQDPAYEAAGEDAEQPAHGLKTEAFDGYSFSMPTTDAMKEYLSEMSSQELQARNDALQADIDAGNLFLINKEHPVDRDYRPTDLADIKYYASDRSAECRYMRAEAAQAFHSLVEAAQSDGHTIVMTTAFRSYDFQSMLYNNYVKNYGQEEADTFSAKPGTSEHQSGMATDISSPSVDYRLTGEYGNTEEGKWVAANAVEYGFILRFPEGKSDITGYIYEPWHIRYVGMTAAAEITTLELTLEEYLEANGIN